MIRKLSTLARVEPSQIASTLRASLNPASPNRAVDVEYMVMKMTTTHTFKVGGEIHTLRQLQEAVYDKIWEFHGYSKKHGSPSNIELYGGGVGQLLTDRDLTAPRPNEELKQICLSLYINHNVVRDASRRDDE